jgi:hypothetical protein
MSWGKVSAAIGSATPDPVRSESAALPVPAPTIANKPAPGQTGPKGLSPRTTYGRSNTGAPPIPDAGASSQKSMTPGGLQFLNKAASKEPVMSTMIARPSMSELAKVAMESYYRESGAAEEAAARFTPEETKEASAASKSGSVSTEYVHKVANALSYIIKSAEETSPVGPGKGPNTIDVSKSPDKGTSPGPNEMGQARSATMGEQPQVARVEGEAPTAMATNEATPGTQQTSISATKQAALKRNLEAMGIKDQMAKEASLLQRNLRACGIKLAEDPAAPAKISTGKMPPNTPPEGSSASEEAVPAQPSGASMVASNEAAMNYTKRDAKSEPKSDMGKMLDEPAQSASTDSTLQKVLQKTDEAGAKIASPTVRAAAARALLSKLANEASDSVKSRKSTGFTASNL